MTTDSCQTIVVYAWVDIMTITQEYARCAVLNVRLVPIFQFVWVVIHHRIEFLTHLLVFVPLDIIQIVLV